MAGSVNDGRALTSCAEHFGHPAGNCTLCKIGGTFSNEASSVRSIAAHRRRGTTTPTRSAYDVAAQERARLAKLGRKPKR
jgi:hypothetical protein